MYKYNIVSTTAKTALSVKLKDNIIYKTNVICVLHVIDDVFTEFYTFIIITMYESESF